jgi:predicted ATP-binding protein involved in virulence
VVVKKGDIVLCSSGEYSDYSIMSVGRANKDFNTDELKAEYLSINPEEKKDYSFVDSKFIKWLVVDKELLEEITYTEWHISDYGNIDEAWAEKRQEEERQYNELKSGG